MQLIESLAKVKRRVQTAFQGVIFDMDSTLFSSTEAEYLAWKKLFADHGRHITMEQYLTMPVIKNAAILQQSLSLEENELPAALAKKMDYLMDTIVEAGIQITPFAESFIQQLQQQHIKIALVTNARKEKMSLLLEKLNLEHYFDVIVAGDEVQHGKPAPDLFIRAMEKLLLPTAGCLAIENAPNGVLAAKNASIKCVAITTTHTEGDLIMADHVIHSFQTIDFRTLCGILAE